MNDSSRFDSLQRAMNPITSLNRTYVKTESSDLMQRSVSVQMFQLQADVGLKVLVLTAQSFILLTVVRVRLRLSS